MATNRPVLIPFKQGGVFQSAFFNNRIHRKSVLIPFKQGGVFQ